MLLDQRADKKIVDSMYKDGYLYAQFGEYWRREKGYKMFKIPVDADFICPNWDGRLSVSGCIFCPGFGKDVGRPTFHEVQGETIKKQVSYQMEYHRNKGVAEKFMVYFYPATNTYQRVDVLKKLFDEAMMHKDAVGLVVGTRPDCLPDEVVELLASYIKKGKEVWVELGQQTTHYKTLKLLNRGHGLAEGIDAVRRLKEKNIWVLTHMLLGLPGETRMDMIESARVISAMGVDAVKIYPLLVMKNTALAKMWEEGKYKALEFDEYVGFVCDFLEHLSPYIIIQRLSKDCGLHLKLAPEWNTFRMNVVSAVEKELKKRQTKQGSRHKLGLGEEELEPLKH